MKTFGEILKELRKQKGMSQEELAEKLGTKKQVISRYENNQRNPKISVAIAIAEIFGISVSELTGDETPTIDTLPPYDNIFPISTQRIPLLGEIACGEPIFAQEDRESYILVGTDIKADFCLRCKGDSMVNARIQDGDIVFIRKQPTVENGEIAAVIIGDEATLKRVKYMKEKNLLILKAENPQYDDLVYQGEELSSIKILGKAIAFQSDAV